MLTFILNAVKFCNKIELNFSRIKNFNDEPGRDHQYLKIIEFNLNLCLIKFFQIFLQSEMISSKDLSRN